MRRLAVPSLVLLTLARGAEAHTLDEYVQALRVSVTGTEIQIFLDLTAGTNIASTIIGRVDTNGDGTLSPAEAEAYGRAVLGDLIFTLDDAAVPLSLSRVEVPTPGEIRERQAAIRITASAPHTGGDGPHRLAIRNTHLPALSVYLANALLPGEDVRIVRQSRDYRQQTYWLEYQVQETRAPSLGWLLVAGAGLVALVRLRG
jgi:hypothetical protein